MVRNALVGYSSVSTWDGLWWRIPWVLIVAFGGLTVSLLKGGMEERTRSWKSTRLCQRGRRERERVEGGRGWRWTTDGWSAMEKNNAGQRPHTLCERRLMYAYQVTLCFCDFFLFFLKSH